MHVHSMKVERRQDMRKKRLTKRGGEGQKQDMKVKRQMLETEQLGLIDVKGRRQGKRVDQLKQSIKMP